jgi:hypothetical protein
MSAASPVFLGLVAVVACAAPALAGQGERPLPSRPVALPAVAVFAESPSQQLVELARWTRDYAEWKTWYVKWRNRLEPGLLSARERREAPDPPSWLAGMCVAPLDDKGPLGDACTAWREWAARGEAASIAAAQQAQARQQREAPTKAAWWERVHVDALWPMTQVGSSTLGVAGMHATVHVTARLQVFLAPGMMMMRVPAMNGDMTWSAGTDWGFSFRLFDFRLPGAGRPSTLHFNLVRVWVLGGQEIARPGEMYLAGFSMSFKRR